MEQFGGLSRLGLLGSRHQSLEAVEVERVGLNANEIPGRARENSFAAQCLPQARDPDLKRLPRRLGRLLTPQLVDQPVRTDDLTRVKQQVSEDRPLFRSGHRYLPLSIHDLERAENPELHWTTVTAP